MGLADGIAWERDHDYDTRPPVAGQRPKQAITLYSFGDGYLRDFRGRVLARPHSGHRQRQDEATARLIEEVR